MGALFSRHSLVLQTSFAEIKRRAVEQASVAPASKTTSGKGVKGKDRLLERMHGDVSVL
jgi:hypothetical protein